MTENANRPALGGDEPVRNDVHADAANGSDNSQSALQAQSFRGRLRFLVERAADAGLTPQHLRELAVDFAEGASTLRTLARNLEPIQPYESTAANLGLLAALGRPKTPGESE